MSNSVYATLSPVNVNDKTEKKNGLTYLGWAWAWATLLSFFPDATYTIYENAQGWNYHTDGKTCWVKTGVTVEGKECIEYLPVMDFRNRSIPLDQVTSADVNKAIQRSLTKAVARHGLGLYIYAGEDLPEETEEDKAAKAQEAIKVAALIKEIDQLVREVTKDMDRDAKKEFASAVIVPTIGVINYKTCTELNKLQALLEKLKVLNK